METEHEELREYRKSIDNIDAALVFLLAERFRITKKVGYYKKEHDLPAGDPAREAEQIDRLKELSESADFDPEFSRKFLAFITEEVIRHHERIKNGE
ncbi:MAG: chorismate mutase [Spirochaetaceae bacterium]